MRILAIRGKNLASLDGEFEVDLVAGLGGSGLFAITGPTGAGKSTLLDALCVALFDRTPRLADRGGARIGRDDDDPSLRLQANDVRSLLRRGTTSGHAEVEFEGLDGRRYRARWDVWRAGGRVNGRLQGQTVTLTDVEEDRALGGHTKTETLPEIQRLLGLTFDQFRRSVLLAQGDFAAFLRASGSERADLLEKMTGTDIYSRLSERAYRKAADEEQALKGLEHEAGAVQLLSPEEREQAERELTESMAAEKEAVEEEAEARRAVEWHDRLAALAREEGTARQDLEGSRRAEEGLAPLREELARVEEAEPLRAVLGDADGALRDLEEATKAHEAAQAEVEGCRQAREAADLELQKADRRLEEAARRHEEALPQLTRAREVDTLLEAARRAHAEAEEAARQADEAAAKAGQEASALAEQVGQAEARLSTAETWFREHEDVRELVRQWDRWRDCLDKHGRAREAAEGAEGRLPGLREQAEEARRQAGELEQAFSEACAALTRAEAEREAAEKAEAEIPSAALRTERQALDERLSLLKALARAAAEADRAKREEKAARDEAEAARNEASEAGNLAREREAWARDARPRLEEARQARDRIVASLGLEEQRQALREGEPCPLCGAESHPYALHGSPGATLRDEQERRIRDLEKEVEGAGRTAAEASARAEARAKAAEAAGRRAETHRAERARWGAEWASLASQEPPGLPTEPAEEGVLPKRTEEVEGRRAALERKEHEAELRTEAARKAREERDGRQKVRDRADDVLARGREALRGAEEALKSAEALHEKARADMAVLEGELAGAFPDDLDWRPSLHRTPGPFRERCETRVDEWARFERDEKEAKTLLADLRPQAEGARRGAEAASTEARNRAADLSKKVSAREDLQRQREGLLGGRAADLVEGDLRRAILEAKAGADAARKTAEGAREAEGKAAGRRDSLASQVESRGTRLDQARQALAALLEERGLEEEDLRGRLSRGADWLQEARDRVETLKHQLLQARILVEERERARREHEERERPEGSAEEARAAREAAGVRLRELNDATASCRARLKMDEEARTRQQGLLERIEEQRRRSEVWASLRQVIGSADGKKFKVFAQSLTLEALLEEANRHLRELAPRYSLERVPPPREATSRSADDHLELQVVDRDMGDSVRSVQSLSGGETFLVSLALALGLSALAAERARIDSLFIDEGFGSLDADTLDTALSCLESLQATGRQVGLISHVQGLAERIGARVSVERVAAGRSRVRVVQGT